ncbi:MAG: uvrC 1 [Myxococcaceae bacterium]|nr:uvrC 1 [Myxococcaceae bacterium]
MASLLRDLRVLVLDCQAGGATPAYGDLLELGWAVSDPTSLVGPVQSYWIEPRTERPISRPVRELTGWSRACLDDAISELEAWRALREASAALAQAGAGVPTVIHFARFELPFLRDLSTRLEPEAAFPFDTIDLHAVAARLFPDLPRRNIRALAGFLGHSPELLRRAAGHVEATAFIWRALLPTLEQAGISRWDELHAFLSRPSTPPAAPARRKGRIYPLAPEVRRRLPDRPGVYRFVRRHGDIIYVGKAASLKKRVASHFASGARPSERNLEMLTQVHDIVATETPSVLEAALLETDEIKRIDPPYNVQLRGGERSAWFAARDLRSAVTLPDESHRVGPLPSERALSPLAALIALSEGAAHTPVLLAQALAVSTRELPPSALFEEGFARFASEHLGEAALRPSLRVEQAARRLWLARGRKEVEVADDVVDASEAPSWDLARVRRRLERNLIQSGLLRRRARWLCLLADADIAYREPNMACARVLRVALCDVRERRDLDTLSELAALPSRRPHARDERQRAFDAASYDRLRVLATELRRVLDDGGEVSLRVGTHVLADQRLARLMRDVY